jgi:hypothetical protein
VVYIAKKCAIFCKKMVIFRIFPAMICQKKPGGCDEFISNFISEV